jgi:hypothetical protein
MKEIKVASSGTKKSSSSKMINKLIEALMVKTGVKAGPEATFK